MGVNGTDSDGPGTSGTTVLFTGHPVLRKCAILSGAGTVLIGILGIIGLYLNLTVLRSIYPGYQPMAFSAAVLSILFGAVLVSHTLRPFTGRMRVFIQLVVAAVAVTGALELPLNVQGRHFIVETVMVQAGNALAGQLTTPISPGALCIVIAVSIGFFLLLIKPTPSKERQRELDAICLAGLAVVLVSFTFLMSYIFGAPFLYGTPLIPIAAPTTLALTCIGIGLVAAAGPAAFPLRYFIGPSTSARLLRTFLPLVLAIVLLDSFLDVILPLFNTTRYALEVSVTLVVFSVITGYVVIRVSRGLGMALEAEERKRREAEGKLARQNENLAATNEELTATGEELRANLDELARREGELRESEEKYRSLFENLLEGYAYCRMIYDESGRPDDFIYLEVNRAFDEIIGTKTVTGKRVSEVFPGIKEEFPDLFEIYGKVALSGRPEAFDIDFRPSGKWLHISVYSPAKEHFVAIFEDITGRRKAENVLTLYKIFTENAHDLILFIRKRDGRIIEANKAAVMTYGYTREELLGMTIFELRASDRREEITSQMERASGEGLVFSTLHRKKDGSDLPVEVSSVSMAFENELVLVSIIRDISERKRAEETQTLLASIVTNSEDAIYGKTLDGIITSWNSGAEKIYGYTAQEAIGRHVSFLTPPEYADDIETILKTIGENQPVRYHETVRMRKDGGRINTAISVSPIKNADGVVIGASTIARDITEQKRVESALVVANRKLSLLNSITRHDIRNQLLALGGFLELYHEEYLGDTRLQGYFERLIKSVRVIGNQIEFAKSYQELGVKSPEWYRVEEVAGVVAGAGGFGAIPVSTGTGPLEIFADPMFEKVFFNLFDNAARHGEHVTRVSISFEQRNGRRHSHRR